MFPFLFFFRNHAPFLFFFFFFIFLVFPSSSSSAIDFLFNSFKPSDLELIRDARVDSSLIRLTNDSNQFSIGRAFYPTPLPMRTNNSTNISSFSTTFIFSILPEIQSSPGFGIAFVLSNSTSPANAISGQYFGLFTSTIASSPAPLLAIEFDTGENNEFKDPNDNHVGIDLNSIVSTVTEPAHYYNSTDQVLRPIDMKSGQNVRAWIEFDGTQLQINVTIAPAGESKPPIPLISYISPEIANYIADQMFVGFSASKVTWVERQRILAWSLSDTGRPARELNTSNLPVFLPPAGSSSSPPSPGLIAGVSIASVVFVALCLGGLYWVRRRRREARRKREEEEEMEDWELEYWPHRYSYEELRVATRGFAKEELLGYGGFGRVYKGVVGGGSNRMQVAVKCVSHESKQGVREFMAEISSMGRLQHKNLVQMRGWCRKGKELMLVYDYMPNGSLNRWIFDRPEQLLGWEGRRRVLEDVAEGLLYLHHGWNQVRLLPLPWRGATWVWLNPNPLDPT